MYVGLHKVKGGQSTEQTDPQTPRDEDVLPSGIQNSAFRQVNGEFSELQFENQ